MLRYLARTLSTAARARIFRDGRLISRTTRRVGLHQIDLNLHMNQAVYAEEMELSRTDWAIRSGAWKRWMAAGVKPVVAEQRIVYRRELEPLQRYTLDSRAVRLDGKLLRFETHLLVGERVHAKGEVALIFVGPGGVVREGALRPLVTPYLAEPLAVEDWRVASR